jgi:hypothetical protein
MVERCRAWKHPPDCEYLKKSRVPLSMESAQPLLCSYGNGLLPKHFISGVSHWDSVSKHFVRAAVSPCFPAPFSEELFDFHSISKSEQLADGKRKESMVNEVPQYADLRSEKTFPSFNNLPGDNDVDLEFFQSADGFSYYPPKHWGFLAEIASFGWLVRLSFFVKDKNGVDVPIHFHTDDRGRELDPAYIEEGYNVAVLYAEQHGFIDLSIGIRHESPTAINNDDNIKISVCAHFLDRSKVEVPLIFFGTGVISRHRGEVTIDPIYSFRHNA